jgi:hypothetical protein
MMKSGKFIWGKAKKAAKFVWRHFLTLSCLTLATYAFIYTNPIVSRVLITLCITAFLDWAKQFIKLTPNPERYHHHTNSHAVHRDDQWWNPYVMGTPAYLMRNSDTRYN